MKYLNLLLLLALFPAVIHAEDKPNILYLLADDLGFADTGFQGCKDVPTPNIDSIANNGVRFTSGYVSASVCSPSRAGLLTGRYQTRFGHEFNTDGPGNEATGLPTGQKTAGDWFKEVGYATGQIGKWHIGDSRLPQYDPNQRGFTDSVVFAGQKKLPPLLSWRNGKREMANDPYVDLAMGREAAAFIENNKSTPWYLYVAFLSPHAPLDISPGADKPFEGIADAKRRKIAAMISLLDQSVGRILKALRDSGQEERTLIVFHSDNGAPFGSGSNNTPLRGYKSTLREGGIRMPFAMQWKGTLPAGRVVDTPIISLDILPTALAAANVTVPAGAKLDGVNLLPFLTGKAEAPQRSLFWRYGEQYAVRQGDWKLVHTMEQVSKPPIYTTGLYNLATDLTETHDLSAEHPDKVKALQALWDEWNAKNVKALWGGGTEEDAAQVSGGKPKKK